MSDDFDSSPEFRIDPAHPEHNLAGVLTFESVVFDSVKKLVPPVSAVHLPASGVYTFTAFIALKKAFPGEGMSAGLAAIAAVQHDGAGIAGRRNGILLFTGCQSAEAERENQVAQRVHGLTQDDRM